MHLGRHTPLERPKSWSQLCVSLPLGLLLCASHPSCVHLFDISTSKSAPTPTLKGFKHFDFQVCSEPQRRARTSSRSQLPKVLWSRGVLSILASKCPSRHCGRAIVDLSSDQMPPHPSAYLFDPPEPQNIGNTQCFATFLPFFLVTLSCLSLL